MTRALLPFLAGAVLLLSAVGCDGGGASAPSAPAPVIPDAFSYETTRPVDVALQVRNAEGAPVPNVPLRLFADDGEMEVASGVTDETGRLQVRLSRPVREVALIARSSYLGLPDSVRIPIRDGQARHVYSRPSASSTAIDRSALPEADPNAEGEASATRTYQPGKDQFASLAFEDLWPADGDYDFNDMVVDYNVVTQATPGGDVTGLTATFVTRAVGASFANGFGVSLPIEPRRVEQVRGTDLREGIVTTRPNGTEAGTDNAVIVVYDNVHNRTSRAGGFFNTDPSMPYRPPDTIRVEVAFQPAVPPAQLGTAPYNPFIFVNGDRSREVHLPDVAPTAHASADWFGKSQDASDASAGRFYKTRSNRPWALHLPASFRYPKEKAGIRSAYRRLQPWAASGGRQFQDWHSSTAPGYRRPEQLYTQP